MLSNKWLLFTVLSIASVSAQTWDHEMEGVGTMRYDGTLYIKMYIGEIECGSNESIAIQAVYAYDRVKGCYSWTFPQLTSVLRRNYREGWEVLLPGGIAANVNDGAGWKRSFGTDVQADGSGWYFGGDGWILEFQKGLLAKLRTPMGRSLKVVAKGMHIKEILLPEREAARRCLLVEYDKAMQPVKITGRGAETYLIYSVDGTLQEIIRGKSRYLAARYRADRKLESIAMYEGEPVAIAWWDDNALTKLRTISVGSTLPFSSFGRSEYRVRFSQGKSDIVLTENGKQKRVIFNLYNP